jgi:hypothetical protein
MDVGVKRPLDSIEDHPSQVNRMPPKFHINLFPRTNESAAHERNYMLEVLKAMLPEDIYNKTKKYILRCNYLKKEYEYVDMPINKIQKIFQHFLSLDNSVYEVIIELGIFTPFHIIILDLKGIYFRYMNLYNTIIDKLGYDPIVLGGEASPYYLYSIAALSTYHNISYPQQPILYDSIFKQNIRCGQILDNLHMCIYSSPNYVLDVTRINTDDIIGRRFPAGYWHELSIFARVGIIMYKNYVFCIDYMPDNKHCSCSTIFHLWTLLMKLLGEIDSKRDGESNNEYLTRLSNYNVELSNMFNVTNITYEIANFFMYNHNIQANTYNSICEIINKHEIYIKHPQYITELVCGVCGLYGLRNNINLKNIIYNSNYNDNYKDMLSKMYAKVNKNEPEKTQQLTYMHVNNKTKALELINYINKNFVSNPSKYYFEIIHMIYTIIKGNVIDECLIYLNLDIQTKKELMRGLLLYNGTTFPNKFVARKRNWHTIYIDSEYQLYCYNIMKHTLKEFPACHNSYDFYRTSYIKNVYLQGGPERWQEQLILYTDIEKGFELFLTVVKDIRKLIVQYVLGKSFNEMSPAEKYYYSSIYNGERFIYDSAISM